MKITLKNNKKECSIPRFIIILTLIWSIYSIVFSRIGYLAGALFAAFTCIMFMFLNNEKRYLFILFAIPFAAIYKIDSNMPSTLILLYLIYIVSYYVDRNKLKIKDYINFFIFIVLQISTMLIFRASFIGIISFAINLIFVKICIRNFLVDKYKVDLFYKSAYTLGISVALEVVIANILPNIPYIISFSSQTLLESVNRFCALNGDPNYYSQIILVALVMIISIFIEEKRINKIAYIILFMFLALSGMKSLSKSYYLTLVVVIIMMAYYFIIGREKMITKKVLLRAITIIPLAVVIFILIVNKLIIPLFEVRNINTDILTGRGDIWIDYINMIKSNYLIPICGVGFANGKNILYQFCGNMAAAHNMYIELVVEIGLIGIMAIACFFYEIRIKFKTLLKNSKLLFIFILLITSLGLSISSSDLIFVLLPLLVVIEN